MVAQIQKIEETEEKLRVAEADFVELQAEMAIQEAHAQSIKSLLAKTSQALEEEQRLTQQRQQELQHSQRENSKLVKRLEEKEQELNNALDQISEFLSRPNLPTDPFLQNWMIIKDSQLQTTRQMLEDWAIVARLVVEQLSIHLKSWEKLQQLLGKELSIPKIDFEDILGIEQNSFPEDFGALIAFEEVLMKSLYDKIVAISGLDLDGTIMGMKNAFEMLRNDIKRKISFKKYARVT